MSPLPKQQSNGNIPVAKIYCTGCGRFLGISGVKSGFAILLCKCKKTTVLLGENEPLETIEMLSNLPDTGMPPLTKSH